MLIEGLNQILQMLSIMNLAKSQPTLWKYFLLKTPAFNFGKGKRVRQLSQVKIQLPKQQEAQVVVAERIDYVSLRSKMKQLNWQQMQFDKLCALPQEMLQLIHMQIKKDKFNVDDTEFYQYSLKELHVKHQQKAIVLQRLNPYYHKLYHLINNHHEQYNQLVQPTQGRVYYQAEMYIMDLKDNSKLKNTIEYFINNVNHPKKLELVAEPSLIKHLLSIKRELIMQGIHFQSEKQQKIKKKITRRNKKINEKQKQQEQNLEFIEDQIEDQLDGRQNNVQTQQDQENEQAKEERQSKFDLFMIEALKQCKHKVNILKVLGYQYQFWVDVKHNRGKNGVQQDYIIQERQIQNPNESKLVKQKHPKIKVRYIVHKKKKKNYTMHFCIKANLLIEVDGSTRTVKVQWKGPSNNAKDNEKEVSFVIIDYEHLMRGNPTIKPIFFF